MTFIEIVVIAEVFFVALVFFFFRSAILSRRLRQVTSQLEMAKEQLSDRHKVLDSAVDHQSGDVVEKQADASAVKLANAERRIENLEKFKKLYFELENKLSPGDAGDEKGRIEVLQRVIENQNKLVGHLKSKFKSVSEKYELEKSLTDDLKDTIDQLEQQSAKLKVKLGALERSLIVADMTEEELAHYKERASKLERSEKILQRDRQEYQQAIERLKGEMDSVERRGAEKRFDLEKLSNRLADKERELKSLRQECETIGKQYEELAMKSLQMASSGEDISSDQKDELDRLRDQVNEATLALGRKQAECEMLENSYLELENQSHLNPLAAEMAVLFEDRRELESKVAELTARIEAMSSEDVQSEMQALRKALAEKESELADARQDYQELKVQFLEVAEEEVKLRRLYQELKAEFSVNKVDLEAFKSLAGQADEKQRELDQMQREYNKLEERYLSLIEKYQGSD